ncbi:MAG TPA: hypothetical protein VIK52_14220 [Opitutaceae bacterium]
MTDEAQPPAPPKPDPFDIQKPDPFDSATYYTTDDSAETLSCGSVSEAIEEGLDGWASPDCDMVELIREHAPITIYAYEREEFNEEHLESWAESALERLYEEWCDEYGGPDGDDEFEKVTRDALPEQVALFRKIIAKVPVWRCKQVAVRVYNADEVEAMLREDSPYLFEKPSKP